MIAWFLLAACGPSGVEGDWLMALDYDTRDDNGDCYLVDTSGNYASAAEIVVSAEGEAALMWTFSEAMTGTWSDGHLAVASEWEIEVDGDREDWAEAVVTGDLTDDPDRMTFEYTLAYFDETVDEECEYSIAGIGSRLLE